MPTNFYWRRLTCFGSFNIMYHLQNKPGTIFWITGYPGAGKTTIANALYALLRPQYANIVMIDGDEFRASFSQDLGFDPAGRKENAWRIARLTQFLSNQGLHTIVPTVSLFKDVRTWVKNTCPNYREIFVRVSQTTLELRDKKNLYSGSRAGSVSDLPGYGSPAEEPLDPDLLIENDERRSDFRSVAECIRTLLIE